MQHFCSVSATPLNKRVWHPYFITKPLVHNAFVVNIVAETKFTVQCTRDAGFPFSFARTYIRALCARECALSTTIS